MHVFHTSEYAFLNVGIVLFQLANEFFRLLSLAVILPVVARRARVRKLACALYEMQIVVVSPRFYIVFAHEIKGAYELHSFKVRTVKFRHHSLYLRAVQHPHEYCLDDVVVMMSERDFVATELLCEVVQISASHPCAKIARRLVNVVHALENIRLEYGYRHVETTSVFFDYTAIFGSISRVHNKIFDVKIHVAVTFEFLKTLCHEHGIFSARYAHRNSVSVMNKVVFFYRFDKFAEYIGLEFLAQTLLDFGTEIVVHLLLHLPSQPRKISVFETVCVVSLLA